MVWNETYHKHVLSIRPNRPNGSFIGYRQKYISHEAHSLPSPASAEVQWLVLIALRPCMPLWLLAIQDMTVQFSSLPWVGSILVPLDLERSPRFSFRRLRNYLQIFFAVGAASTAPGHEFFFHFTFSIDPLLWHRLLVVAMRALHAPHTHGWRGATPGCTCRPWKVVCAWSSTIFSWHFVFWILGGREVSTNPNFTVAGKHNV